MSRETEEEGSGEFCGGVEGVQGDLTLSHTYTFTKYHRVSGSAGVAGPPVIGVRCEAVMDAVCCTCVPSTLVITTRSKMSDFAV